MHSAQKPTEVKKRSIRQSDPVDAEDLIRRLNAYLAEQEAKATKSWDLRIRRPLGRRGQDKGGQKSSSTSDGIKTNTMAGNNPDMVNLTSQPIMRNQRHLENKTCDLKRNSENITHQSTQSRMRHIRNQYLIRNHKSYKGHDEDSDENFYSPKRVLHIHTRLSFKSRRGWKSGQTSSEATTEDSRNSNEMCRQDIDNPIWLAQEQNSHRIRKTTSHLGKKWDWAFVTPSKMTSRDYSLDKTSVETTEILPSEAVARSRQKIRNSFMALFRRNSSI
ncbi:hypothetical protein OnM2_032049 [Erysiphe neolycopersici]|uniref:Uncharacterized protein n=1 Tax=Erysiphe neolycopersici TaxID=212602 RepID=A0A420HYU4_9PEZI|nr:hypothetical protein OnM2_032049 [Erysiphe neolycopersici]